MTLFIIHSNKNVEQTPQHVKQSADRDCIPNKYQPPPLNKPERPLVVPNGIGLSANRPTAITPTNVFDIVILCYNFFIF